MTSRRGPAARDALVIAVKAPIRFAIGNLVFGRGPERRVGGLPRRPDLLRGPDDRAEEAAALRRRLVRLRHRGRLQPAARHPRVVAAGVRALRVRSPTTADHGHHAERGSATCTASSTQLAAAGTRRAPRCSCRCGWPRRLGRRSTPPPRPSGRWLTSPRRGVARAARHRRPRPTRPRSPRPACASSPAPSAAPMPASVDFLSVERATTLDMQWLIRRAFCRGVGEPALDVFWRPQAIVVEPTATSSPTARTRRTCCGCSAPRSSVEDRGLVVHGEQGPSPPGAAVPRRAAGDRVVPGPRRRAAVRAAGGGRLPRGRRASPRAGCPTTPPPASYAGG